MKHHDRRIIVILLAVVVLSSLISCASAPQSVAEKLAEWRKGVWISGAGTYTIYTDSHYFVLSYTGDSANPNIYCGASQFRIHDKGTARRQTIRIRQFPGGGVYGVQLPVVGVVAIELAVQHYGVEQQHLVLVAVARETGRYVVEALGLWPIEGSDSGGFGPP